jgi:peroxiredoxin (alkyl hydroperoxide reductase subunit C)
MDEIKERKGTPLLGEDFPEMKVQTTNGIMELPKAYSGKWFVLSNLRKNPPERVG